MSELLEPFKFGTLEDRLEHRLDNKPDIIGDQVISKVKTDKCLEKADDDNDEQSKENDGFLHHDLEDNEHGPEEAETVQIQK